jgi:hypothetical protein
MKFTNEELREKGVIISEERSIAILSYLTDKF